MDQHQFEKAKTALVQTILGQYEWDNLAVTEPLSRIVGHDLPYSIKFKVVDIAGILRDNIKVIFFGNVRPMNQEVLITKIVAIICG